MVTPAFASASVSGPWNTTVLQGGIGFRKSLPKHATVLGADSNWTVYAWIRPQFKVAGRQLLAGFGDPAASGRYFLRDHGKLGFWSGKGSVLQSHVAMRAGHWQFVAAVARNGQLALYVNGKRVATGLVQQVAVTPQLIIGPVTQPWPHATHFAGKVAAFTIEDDALDGRQLATLAKHPPNSELTRFAAASPHWSVQTRQMVGLKTLQPPSTLPNSRAPFSAPKAKPPGKRIALKPDGKARWVLDRWSLASAPKLRGAAGASISSLHYKPGKAWMVATVPGTVLTTLVDRGVYPNPAYGLNNMAIPIESLDMHDWWYRTVFTLPANVSGRHLHLTFNGINYAAAVWVNGTRVGRIKGAFIRGQFDVTSLLRPGQRNVIAVRVSPPPYPGLPTEESLVEGPGPNGGIMTIDGPTFFASEGWDWIPSIRDRDTGLWQDVTLHATGAVSIGDTHVVTRLPHPQRHRLADVDVAVPLRNTGSAPVSGQLRVAFGGVSVDKHVAVPAGGTVVHLKPAQYPQLVLHHPHLWWPNGYGQQYLYRMHVSFKASGKVSDQKQFQFGVRQISYELSLFDGKGRLQRVLVTPDMSGGPAHRVVDVTHQAILKTPHGWAYSLRPGTEHSPAVKPLKDTQLTPYLAIRVNGVRIAIKGGSWGTDDFMKRISRKRMQPYFQLAHDAHLDVIRNWTGENTEPVFYKLADKYGLLVLNDFWESTQNYNMQAENVGLFLRNAADVIRRYRNHPSIALWFGRNEGVPQPSLNKGLDKLIAKLDGTRLYMPSSNDINLAKSGPYDWQPPVKYFTQLAKGFAVEIGTMSFPTLDAFKAMMPRADRWPISDDWAYHGWHQSGNGGTHGFMQAMRTRFGAPSSLQDFVRKAQMMNYVDYRAIFEGFNAHLWTQNSGRLLWMTHPAWPNTTWQIYSSDYATNASYYGVKEAAQPIHVQMNLPDRKIAVINNTRRALEGASVAVDVYGLAGDQLEQRKCQVGTIAAGSVAPACHGLDLDSLVHKKGVVFVSLALQASKGRLLSHNFYWTAAKPRDLKRLNALPKADLKLTASHDGKNRVRVRLGNPGATVALNAKLTLVNGQGQRILPAYYSDNYVDLAPHGSRDIEISVSHGVSLKGAKVELHGWNEVEEATTVQP